ncbi:MAG: hypothetical protein JWN72_644, partial [Thermoleophilia bacterium]|nr:hypothetical protein [Thermoleophilia bacterium]
LIGADDVAFGPAFESDWGRTETGTAVYTRNGYTIDHAVNAKLPDGDATQPRGAVVAEVKPPKGAGENFTVVGTHLAHLGTDTEGRADQLQQVSKMVNDIRDDGSFDYTLREQPFIHLWDRTGVGKGFPRDIVFGGDLNAEQAEVDRGVRATPLIHVIDELDASRDPDLRENGDDADENTTARRIDHIYTTGFNPIDADVAGVPNVEYRGSEAPTDHKGFVTQLVRGADYEAQRVAHPLVAHGNYRKY